MVMIDVNYDTMIHRIQKRGRKFEQVEADPSLERYYKRLLKYYDDWRENYSESPLMVIDGNRYDFKGNENDKNTVLNMIEERLVELGNLSNRDFLTIKQRREQHG